MWTINKRVSFHWMAMKITVQMNLILLKEVWNHLFQVINFWMKVFGRVLPTFIEVISRNVWSVVTMNYPIRVEHWDNFEDKVLTKFFCLFISWQKKFNDAITHIRRYTFTRVYPGRNYNIPFVKFLVRVFFCNRQQFDIIACKRLTKRRSMAYSLQVRIVLNFGDIRLQICISIRIWVSKVNLVFVVQKGILEGKCEVRFVLQRASGIPIFIVFNILSCPVPTEILLLRLLVTINHYLHTHLVQRVLLVFIQYVKPHLVRLKSVRHLEKKPLRVSICVDVILQQ